METNCRWQSSDSSTAQALSRVVPSYQCYVSRVKKKFQPTREQSRQQREQSKRKRRVRLWHLRHPVRVLGRVGDGRRLESRDAARRVPSTRREALQDPHASEKNHSHEQTGQGIQAIVSGLENNQPSKELVAPETCNGHWRYLT